LAQYKVLKTFKDIHTKDLYKVDSTIDGGFIEPVKTKLTIDDLKAELDALGVDYKDAKVKADYEKLLEAANEG